MARFVGTEANEIITGTDQADQLSGGGGHDRIYGGAGIDTFVVRTGAGRDFIADFNAAEDRLHMADAGAATASEAYAQFMASSWMEGSSTVYQNAAGDLVTLYGFDRSALTVDNFFGL